ncbi:MAG TPA: hypothetical protein VNT55_19845 [Baekduia sp.]|nr:hypothetical protein [Baekduia sp.]
MNGTRRAAVAVLCALAAPALVAAPGDAVAAAKSKAKACKKGTIRVKTGKKQTRCVKRRVAPPLPKAADRGKLALDLAISPKWPALRDRRGRKVPTTAQVLARVGHGATTKLRAAFKKGLALAAAKAAPRARAAADGSPTGVVDGDNVGFDGDVQAGDYRIFAEFRTSTGDGVSGPQCPTGAGVLDATRRSSIAVTIRILDRAGHLVHATHISLTGKSVYKGQSADDAKFDTLAIDDDMHMVSSVSGGGRLSLTLMMDTHRSATYLMRTGAYQPDSDRLDVSALVIGAPPGVARDIEAELAAKLGQESDRAFAEVVSRGVDFTRGVEARMNDAGQCARLVFDPPSPPAKTYRRGEQGTVTGVVEPAAEPGGRSSGRWTLEEHRNLDITPNPATGTSAALTFTVTDDREPKGTARWRATSKAGVATGTYEVKIEPPTARYRVTGLEYTDQLAADGLPPYLGCTASTSQTNSTTLVASGADADGAVGPALPPPQGSGDRVGLINGRGRLLKTASFNGCQWNDTASARVPCHVMSAGSEDIFVIVDIRLPADGGPAQVTWRSPRIPSAGDVPPVISACEPWPVTGTPLPDVTATVPRATFTDPGTHTIAIDIPADVPGQGGVGMVHSHAHYALTFEKLPD